MKRVFILLILFYTISNLSAQKCLSDGITFTTQSQIDNFSKDYAGCNEIIGDVKIEGAFINNLDELFQIHKINGDLVIQNNPKLTSTDGLSSLTQIDGDLRIYSNSELSNLDGFANLSAIGGNLFIASNLKLESISKLSKLNSLGDYLSISGNNVLASLNGLDNLTYIGAYLNIANHNFLSNLNGLANISTIGGHLNIVGNKALTSFSGLKNLTKVNGYIKISSNESLSSLNGLQNIDPSTIKSEDSNEDLEIVNNPNLSDCEVQSICTFLDFEGITTNIKNNADGCNSAEEACPDCPEGDFVFDTQQKINEFYDNYPDCEEISRNVTIRGDNIVGLNGLSNIKKINGGLFILQNDLLSDLSGLKNLSLIEGTLSIENNTLLNSLQGLQGLERINGSLVIEMSNFDGLPDIPPGPTGLTNLTGLENLTFIGGTLKINENDALISFAGLKNLTTLGGDISISNNYSLTNFDDLKQLTSIDGSIYIGSNPHLTSINGLENIDPVSVNADNPAQADIRIVNNPLLSSCSINSICSLFQLDGVSSVISNNGSECASREQIVNYCKKVLAEEIIEIEGITIYPIPTNGILNISGFNSGYVKLTNIEGRIVLQKQLTSSVLDLSHFPKGLYILQLVTDNHGVYINKVIVK